MSQSPKLTGALGALTASALTTSGSTLPAAFVAKIANGGPFATKLQLGQAVSASPLGFPVKADYCPRCQMDVFTNPDAMVMHLIPHQPDPLDDEVLIRCDCGAHIFLPAYLFQ